MRNTENNYGWLTISLHWLAAGTIIGLFSLGFWMVDLSYYDTWYKQGADLHKSIGALLFLLMLFRVIWKYLQVTPLPINEHSKFEQNAAHIVHKLLYLMIFAIMLTGYLISTADGRAIAVFNWFSIASLGSFFANQADIAGLIHKYLAYSLITVVVFHVIGALKHHFIDKDKTLIRMLSNKAVKQVNSST